jgi:hypothetical protein
MFKLSDGMARVGSAHMRNLKLKTRYICQIENIVFMYSKREIFEKSPPPNYVV